MASIDATINFSYANLTDGRITATPKESFPDVNGDLVVGGIAYPAVAIASGTASIVLPSTKDYGVAYTFVIESGVDPNYTEIDRFDAVIDNVSPQDGNQLLTNFFSQDLLDTSVATISDLLSKDPYLERFAQRIPGFVFKTYSDTQAFVKNDFTFRGSRLYQWRLDTTGTGIDPLTAGNYHDPGNLLDGTLDESAGWLVATSSLVGAGTSTTDVDYDKVTFVALATEPASRENLTQLDDELRAAITPDLSDYAVINATNTFTSSQIFGADITVPDLPSTEDSSKVANSRTVRQIINASASFADLSGRASIIEERYNVGTNLALSTGVNVRNLNTIHVNSGDVVSLTNKVILLKAGTYLMFASAVSNRCGGSKIYLYNEDASSFVSSRSMTGYSGENLANLNQSSAPENILLDIVTLGSDTNISLRHNVKVGGATAGGVGANLSGYSELFSRVMFFRLM